MKKVIVLVLVLLFVSIVSYGQSCNNSGNDRVIQGKTISYAPGGKITLKGGASAVGGSIILKPGDGMNGDGDIIMNLAAGSYVGIGKTSPSYKLDVNGTLRTSGKAYFANKVGIGKSSPSYKLDVNGTIRTKTFRMTDGAVEDYVLTCAGSGGAGVWKELTAGGSSLWEEGSGDDIYYDGSGNVGIGTDDPDRKLSVDGIIRAYSRIETRSGNDMAYLHTSDSNNISEIVWRDNLDDRFRFFFDYWDGTNQDKEVMTLKSNGYVGIGETNPQSELAVNGKITAKEIEILSTGWSDFVFEDGYKLMPLEKLENHIKKEKSLPGIPTEKEVKENGVEIGEMQAKLLEKVEELTLYVIDLKKENTELKKRINALEN